MWWHILYIVWFAGKLNISSRCSFYRFFYFTWSWRMKANTFAQPRRRIRLNKLWKIDYDILHRVESLRAEKYDMIKTLRSKCLSKLQSCQSKVPSPDVSTSMTNTPTRLSKRVGLHSIAENRSSAPFGQYFMTESTQICGRCHLCLHFVDNMAEERFSAILLGLANNYLKCWVMFHMFKTG
jgi:hypothetical protein